MAAPYFFLFNNQGVLIGDPIQMQWNATTRTATYALTGQTAGNKVSFLVNVALEAGKVLFTERVVYIVGSNCEGQEDKPIASCVPASHRLGCKQKHLFRRLSDALPAAICPIEHMRQKQP